MRALNQAIARALTGGSVAAMREAAIAGVEQPEVVAAIDAAADLRADDLKGSGYVLNAIQIAFWAIETQQSFEDAIVSAVMIGDDTDTNAAVTGALAGAFYGYDQIPERWRRGVQQHDRLVALADQLLALASVD